MNTQYREEVLEKLLISHLTKQGFELRMEKVVDDRIPWRPPIFAKKDGMECAIDIRLSSNITDFWLATYQKTYEVCPHLRIFVAIPEDIVVPFALGKKLEECNVGIILVSYEGITYLLEPRSPAERAAAKVIRRISDARIDKTKYQELEPYVKEITDAVNIFEIGCPRDAIGAIGRVLETAIDDFLIEANRRHKISLSKNRRESMDFDTKIRFLASNSGLGGRRKPVIITASEESKMLSVKWDRNIGDHPANDPEIQQLIQDSRAILELGINMIRLMKTKREDL